MLVLCKPPLVRVNGIRVRPRSDHHRISLVGNIDNRNVAGGVKRALCTNADFMADVVGVGASVVHALNVVSVAVSAEAACKSRARWILNINHVEATAAITSHDVCKSTFLIGRNIVGASHACIYGVRRKNFWQTGNTTKMGQIEDLHTVATGVVCDDECVVLVRLDVAPRRRVAGRREEAQIFR